MGSINYCLFDYFDGFFDLNDDLFYDFDPLFDLDDLLNWDLNSFFDNNFSNDFHWPIDEDLFDYFLLNVDRFFNL
jgi:hypothetical protein